MEGKSLQKENNRSESDTYDTFRKGNTAFYSGMNSNRKQNEKVLPSRHIKDSIRTNSDRKAKRSLSAEEIEDKLPNLRQGRGVYGSLPFLATFGMQHREKSVASAVRLRSFESMSKIKVRT